MLCAELVRGSCPTCVRSRLSSTPARILPVRRSGHLAQGRATSNQMLPRAPICNPRRHAHPQPPRNPSNHLAREAQGEEGFGAAPIPSLVATVINNHPDISLLSTNHLSLTPQAEQSKNQKPRKSLGLLIIQHQKVDGGERKKRAGGVKRKCVTMCEWKSREGSQCSGKKGKKQRRFSLCKGTHVEIPVPEPKADEVLVKVKASTINPVDWKLQKGITRSIYSVKFPHVLILAGEVVKVGPAVKKFKPGDKIIAVISLFTGGVLAEYAVAKESSTVQRPEEVTAAQAAGLPIAGLTAYCALSEVTGIKFDGSGDKKNILITAGSDGVLDYYSRGATLKSPSGKKYDYVLHCTTGIPWSTFEPILSSKGKVIDLAPIPSVMLTFVVKKIIFSKKQLVPYCKPGGENLEKLVKLAEEVKVKTVVDSTYPLSKGEEG
ncbi:Quinone-oxidoreductase homolog, chloroplastic-like protein [Drosera capensis]